MLEIRNLHAAIDGNEILKGINLTIKKGEIHAIMGPNGSGKSTLAKVLAGHPAYEVTEGEVIYEGKNLLEMSPDERAREGVFMAFQYPIEVPGVSNAQFLRLAYNEKRKHLGEEELDPLEFKDLLKERAKVVEMDASFMTRSVNEGFSGGEKKRNEILQMAVLEPKLAILDETDSGLDIDALRVVAGGVNQTSQLRKRGHRWSLTINDCSITSFRISFTCWRMDALPAKAEKNWRWNWKRRVTTGSRLRTRQWVAPAN